MFYDLCRFRNGGGLFQGSTPDGFYDNNSNRCSYGLLSSRAGATVVEFSNNFASGSNMNKQENLDDNCLFVSLVISALFFRHRGWRCHFHSFWSAGRSLCSAANVKIRTQHPWHSTCEAQFRLKLWRTIWQQNSK